MLEAAPYRGMDGMSIHLDGSIGLGYAKSAITPEETHERQPIISPRTGIAVIADVRLDNRAELVATLPGTPATASDAELILRAYERWGSNCFERLLGDFAIAIWDARTRQIICSRDTSGQRSLFYRLDERTFVAGSEIHQILVDPTVLLAPDEAKLRDYLTPWYAFQNEKQTERTFFSGISSVLPGNVLTVGYNTRDNRTFWTLDVRDIRYQSADDYAEHYLNLFTTVVRDRLRSMHPMGVLLSGGLDSSSIVATAQQIYRRGDVPYRGFSTFSSVFNDPTCDERDLIRDLQEQYGFDAHYVETSSFSGRLQIEPDGFLESPNLGVRDASNAIMRAASDAGVRVVLTGDTADACVGGTRHVFDSLIRQGQVRAVWEHLQPYRRVTGESNAKTLFLYGIAPLLPRAFQRQIMTAYRRHGFRRTRGRLIPTWMPEALRRELEQHHLHLLLKDERTRKYANPTRAFEYRLLYPPEVARQIVPWAIQTWRPFADRRLHEFLLGIPPEQKFWPHPESDNTYAGQKRIVRQAMQGMLPESIRSRTLKTNFRGVWENEVEHQWPEYAAVFGPDAMSLIARRGFVQADGFWQRLQELRAGRYGMDFLYVMKLVSLETWLRTFELPRPRAVSVPPVDLRLSGRDLISQGHPL